MSKRRLGVLTVALAVAVAAWALPAAAVESEGGGEATHENVEMEDVGTGSKTAQEFKPTPFEAPSFFQWIIYPLAGLGIIVVLAVLGLYLFWQPQFGREAEDKKRR